jgi:hypothetical protein
MDEHRSGALRRLCSAGFGSFLSRLMLEPPKQELMLELKGRWDLKLFSEPDGHHWLTAAAARIGPRRTGTRTGGTSHGRNRSVMIMN